MSIRKRLAAIAVTVPLIVGTTLFTATPAQAQDDDCAALSLWVEYSNNMYELHSVFFGSEHPLTHRWAKWANEAAEERFYMC